MPRAVVVKIKAVVTFPCLFLASLQRWGVMIHAPVTVAINLKNVVVVKGTKCEYFYC